MRLRAGSPGIEAADYTGQTGMRYNESHEAVSQVGREQV